jgi:2-phospho-L-lactate guanylyltransferase (CobY/MobA/RfbA family)
MTTHNLLILDKAIQHHYESTEVICPSQEEVENALRDITIELQDLKEQNERMSAVLQELDECASYWSDYDVPVGIHERIKSAIAKPEENK